MSDFDLLLALQKELTDTLKARARIVGAREGSYINNKEAWRK